MGTGYTRADTANNIADGNIINASDLDSEYDAIQSAFDASTGHTHDGTAGEGAPIETIGPSQDVVATASVLRPKTDNTVDLGTTSLEYKDLFLDGTAHIDTLDVDENASITGTLGVTGTTTLGTANITTGTITTADINGGNIDGTIIGATSAAAITGTTITGTSFVTSGDMTFGDNDKAVFGAGSDLQIYHDGDNSYIDDNGTGDLFIRGGDDVVIGSMSGEEYIRMNQDSSVELKFNDATKLYTQNTGATVNGDLTVTGNAVFGDNDKAIFGAGSDLQIYHDGAKSVIQDAGTGNLFIEGSSEINFRNTAQTAYLMRLTDGGDVRLYHAGSPKLATTSTGVDITGTLTSDGLTVDGAVDVNHNVITQSANAPRIDLIEGDTTNVNTRFWQTGGDLRIYTLSDDTTTYSERIRLDHATGDISFYEDTGTTAKFFWDASAENLNIGTTTGTESLSIKDTAGFQISFGNTSASSVGAIGYDNNDKLKIYGNGATRMTIDSSGNVGIGTSSPTLTAGATGIDIYDNSDAQIRLHNSTTGTTTSDGLLVSLASDNSGYFYNYENAPLIFGTNNTERMRIDSSGNVGIGTTSPAFNTGSGIEIERAGEATLRLQDTTNTANGEVRSGNAGLTFYAGAYGTSGAPFIWNAGGTEAMRIDSSGNLLVGKTDTSLAVAGARILPTGQVYSTASGAAPFAANRLSSDGAILELYKDTGPVGSIGTSGDDLTVGNDVTTLKFHNSLNTIHPNGTGSGSDGLTTLGWTNNRFKDLYLSGGVYLGGTGAANKLDDYEEGTWTPYYNSSGATFTYNTQYGSYVRVGNIVHAQFYLNATATGTTSNSAEVQGLPFTAANLSPYHQWGCSCWFSGSLVLQPLTGNNSTAFALWKNGAVSTALASEVAGGRYLVGNVTYRTT